MRCVPASARIQVLRGVRRSYYDQAQAITISAIPALCAVRMALSWPHTTLTTARGQRYIGATILEAVNRRLANGPYPRRRTIQSDR